VALHSPSLRKRNPASLTNATVELTDEPALPRILVAPGKIPETDEGLSCESVGFPVADAETRKIHRLRAQVVHEEARLWNGSAPVD
jgi:hypothetical protein